MRPYRGGATVLKTFDAIGLELEDKAGLALSYSTWGLLASEWGESETAKERFQRAVELFTERKAKSGQMIATLFRPC
jgi:hypothetical protein